MTINLSSSDPTEGTVPASLTFTAANFSVAQTVTVTGVDDALVDGNVALHDCDHGRPAATRSMPRSTPPTSASPTPTTTRPAITVTPTTGLTTTEALGTATFTVVLTSAPTGDVTINLSSSDPTEGTVPASLTFTAANFSVAQTVTVTGVDDALVDGNVAYTIATTVTSGDPIYAAINPADVARDQHRQRRRRHHGRRRRLG